MEDCWNRIGVTGDRSCPELRTVVHCRNCHVFSAAGRSLLERLPPDDYLQEWTHVLAENQRGGAGASLGSDGAVVRNDQSISVMLFRLGTEVLGLPVGVLQEVSPPFVIHSVPQRTNRFFLGLVNIRGEIMLAASLQHLLGLGDAAGGVGRSIDQGLPSSCRMAVAGADDDKWVLPMDEVFGIHLFNRQEIGEAPVVISKAGDSLTGGLLPWKGRSVALLDPDRLFAALRATVSPP
jgi:chemotaxis-related protein WspD